MLQTHSWLNNDESRPETRLGPIGSAIDCSDNWNIQFVRNDSSGHGGFSTRFGLISTQTDFGTNKGFELHFKPLQDRALIGSAHPYQAVLRAQQQKMMAQLIREIAPLLARPTQR